MRSRKTLVAGVVAASVVLGGLIGALAFAPGLGIAQTDDQAGDATSDRVSVDRWCFGGGEGPSAVAADAIGIPHGDLLYAMREGSTIAEVAESENVEPQVVIDALVASWQERLDSAIEDGYFSQEIADEIAAGLGERATDLVNGEFPMWAGHRDGFGFGHGRGPGFGHGPWDDGPSEDEAEAEATLSLS